MYSGWHVCDMCKSCPRPWANSGFASIFHQFHWEAKVFIAFFRVYPSVFLWTLASYTLFIGNKCHFAWNRRWHNWINQSHNANIARRPMSKPNIGKHYIWIGFFSFEWILFGQAPHAPQTHRHRPNNDTHATLYTMKRDSNRATHM